jgi:hypothetical protein
VPYASSYPHGNRRIRPKAALVRGWAGTIACEARKPEAVAHDLLMAAPDGGV